MLLVGLAESVAEAAQQRVLEVRRVHDQAAAGAGDAGQLGGEGGVVADVLEHVDHGHAVELAVGEGQALSVHLMDVGAHQRPDGGHGLRGQVAGGPASAARGGGAG